MTPAALQNQVGTLRGRPLFVPEGREIVAGGGATRNHRITPPSPPPPRRGGRIDRQPLSHPWISPAPLGRRLVLWGLSGGSAPASLHHRLPSGAPPARRSSVEVSGSLSPAVTLWAACHQRSQVPQGFQAARWSSAFRRPAGLRVRVVAKRNFRKGD